MTFIFLILFLHGSEKRKIPIVKFQLLKHDLFDWGQYCDNLTGTIELNTEKKETKKKQLNTKKF